MRVTIAKNLRHALRTEAVRREQQPGRTASTILSEGLADPDRPLLTEADVEAGLSGMGPMEHARVLGQILAARDRRLEEAS